MIVTLSNYKTLKNEVEGKDLNTLTLNETYTALCYLTHRMIEEKNEDVWWTKMQVNMVRRRQRQLLADQGIYVLTAA